MGGLCCYDRKLAEEPNRPNVQYIEPHNEHHQRARIPKEMRDKVWNVYHGEKNIGVCYCCNKQIERYHAGWHCAHVKADVKGGPTIVENLRTCCPHCNLSMGDQNLYVYILQENLKGPGATNANSYLRDHPDQKGDVRTNNWGHKKHTNAV